VLDFGERRLPACSSRQVAANISSTNFYNQEDGFCGENRRASCPAEQAGSLRSPSQREDAPPRDSSMGR